MYQQISLQVIWVSHFCDFKSILQINYSSERDMGLGRNSTRIASRKKTTNYEYESESEESDTNWNERKAKKKLSNGRNNGKNSKKYT